MFYRRYGSGEVDDVVDEKRGEMGFGIVDDGEFCCIITSDGELFGVVDPAQVAAFVLLKLGTAAVRVGEPVDCFRGEIKLSRREA